MSENDGRVNLVTRFTCANCGDQLNITYDTKKPSGTNYENDRITGALKVETYVSVEPCKRCLDEWREPLVTIRNALGIGRS